MRCVQINTINLIYSWVSGDSIIGGMSVEGPSVAGVVSMLGTRGTRGSMGESVEGGGGTEMAESATSTVDGGAGPGAASLSGRDRALASNLSCIA